MIVKGIVPPLITSLHKNGTVDQEGLITIIHHCIKGGVDGIFLFGSCGEGSIFSREEKELLIKTAKKEIGQVVPLLVGVLETSAKKVVEEIKWMEEEGIKYFVVTPPFYLTANNQDEIIAHYRYITEHIKSQIIVYNIPPYVHSTIEPTTMMKLLELPGILAIKDSTGDWASLQKLLFLKASGQPNKEQSILCGNEDFCFASMVLGADGIVPCFGNVYPSFYKKMYQAAQEHNMSELIQYQKVIVGLKELLSYGTSWIGVVKYLCYLKGLCHPYTALGGFTLTEEDEKALQAKIEILERNYKTYLYE